MNGIPLATSFSSTLGFVGQTIIDGPAGWIGSKIMSTDEQMGIALDIIVGIIDGFLGGRLLTLFGIDVASGGMFLSFLTRLFGAMILPRIISLVQKCK